MRQITLAELKAMATRVKGHINTLYLHWSAGHYGMFFEDYHINIDADGSIWSSTDDLTEHKPHTWHRNTGAISVALACCYNATPVDLGPEPPTDAQIESMAQVIAVLCSGLDLPVNYDHVRTHAEQAFDDGYGLGSKDPETKWDLWFLHNDDPEGSGGDIIRGKAVFYQKQGVV